MHGRQKTISASAGGKLCGVLQPATAAVIQELSNLDSWELSSNEVQSLIRASRDETCGQAKSDPENSTFELPF